MNGKVGFGLEYKEIRRKIFAKISENYPWLADECTRQQEELNICKSGIFRRSDTMVTFRKQFERKMEQCSLGFHFYLHEVLQALNLKNKKEFLDYSYYYNLKIILNKSIVCFRPPYYPVLRRVIVSELVRNLENQILADGVITEADVALLREELWRDGKIDKREARLLCNLRNKAKQFHPSFDVLFSSALLQNLLVEGAITAEDTIWMKQNLFHDKIDETKKVLLTTLSVCAKETCKEFDALLKEVLDP